MDQRLDAIRDLIRFAEKRLDEIEWDDPRDPRIENLVSEINYLKTKEQKGELYEPRF
jgi:hypothetical protein